MKWVKVLMPGMEKLEKAEGRAKNICYADRLKRCRLAKAEQGIMRIYWKGSNTIERFFELAQLCCIFVYCKLIAGRTQLFTILHIILHGIRAFGDGPGSPLSRRLSRPAAAICAKPASRPRKLRLSRELAEKNTRLSRRENCGLNTKKSITKVFSILKLIATACFGIPRRRCYVG